jgi:ubiquinone/menaquinone biosynthesis C-methylase UbiE
MKDFSNDKYQNYEKLYVQKFNENKNGWQTLEGDFEVTIWIEHLMKLSEVKFGKVIEIGCGAGNLSVYLSQLGFDVTGIDISETAVFWARKRFNKLNLTAKFLVGDVSNLSLFNSNSFDISIDSLCLHCLIDEDRSKSLSEIYRVLIVGGEFLVITMCGDPKNATLKEHFNPATRYVEFDRVRECYLGEPDDILNELRSVNFEITYHTIIQGNEEAGDQDMLLAICRKGHPSV